MSTQNILDIIKARTSVRGYKADPIAEADQQVIQQFIDELPAPPLGSEVRLQWLSGQTVSSSALRKLGTYGMIRNPMGFAAGVVADTPDGVVDFGYQMERVVLELTRLDLGSCWLGGSFSKSKFSEVMNVRAGEVLPCVVSAGIPMDKRTWLDKVTRRSAGSDQRKPWQEIFFLQDFNTPLSEKEAGDYALPLEMLRLAPSASNRQPWRLVMDSENNIIHFYVERMASYHKTLNALKLADLQRLDVGIGMSHFELTAQEKGLKGQWEKSDPGLTQPKMTEYVVTWKAS